MEKNPLIMPKQWNIHTDTPLVPYIIAERAVWNVLEEKHKGLTPAECISIVRQIAPELVARSERHYSNSESWRRQLHRSKDERYFLEMFMEHWAYGPIKKLLKAQLT